MSYTATCPPMSQAQAELVGKFFGQYEIEVSGLAVYQIDVDGGRHRDDALRNTIVDTIADVGGAVAAAPVAAPVAAVAIPIIGLFPPLGAILAAIMGALSASAPITLPALKMAEYKLNKSIPRAGGKEIAYTEVVWDFSDVSADRRLWSEYLIGAYAAWAQWDNVTGFQHPEQLQVGAAYVARTGRLPPPRDASRRQVEFAQPARPAEQRSPNSLLARAPAAAPARAKQAPTRPPARHKPAKRQPSAQPAGRARRLLDWFDRL